MARILTVESRKSIVVPVNELLSSDGKLELFPEVEEKNYFHVLFRGRELELIAGPYIGLIPINPYITINVKPKLPVSNLSRVIELAQHSIESLAIGRRFYATRPEATISVIEFLANNLIMAMRDIELRGLYKSYDPQTTNSSRPKGRINIQQTLLLNFSRGIKHKIYSRHFEHTLDNPYNQILKYAFWFLAQRLRRLPDRSRRLMHDINSTLALFDKVTLTSTQSLIEFVENEIKKKRIPKSRWYYERALRIALTIISGKGLSLIKHGHEVELSSYSINFETLFENYLRNILRIRIPLLLPGIRVRDGNVDAKKRLFDDSKKPLANPDIVIDNTLSTLAIAEVKYKDKVDRVDINQAITYGCSYRTGNVVLVHQRSAEKKPGKQLLGTIGTIKLFTYAFDLASPDLENEERSFTESIKSLITLSS